MTQSASTMKMPELLVFARAFAIGLVAAELFRVAYYVGRRSVPLVGDVDWRVLAAGVACSLMICVAYAVMRDAHSAALRLGRSLRFDLFLIAILAVWSNELMSPWLAKVHEAVNRANPWWAPTLLGVMLLIFISPLWRTYRPRSKLPEPQLYFLTDDEIETKDEDILESEVQARAFAETVLASGAHSGLVFGIDGPWGTGKSSFVNLAGQYWKGAGADSVIVFRFEPLRYAADPDLSERFIRDLSSTIQRHVFAPEFRPAASRYTRMLKGKADLSLLGFKLSLEPSSETIDELLEDIDDVLKRIRRRVIVVVDDLDRLDSKTVNNVLFTVRRTFKLSQATYILCYDTENLVGGKDEAGKAREFLEKFVNVKLSLFVDSSALRSFLVTDWKCSERRFPSIPSDTMLKLSSVLSEVADILGDDKASKYAPLIGDLRKLKRFVNAVLLMQIEKTDLGKTDFNRRDLINLMLLHLHYPGLFRHIYAEETEGRSGSFSAKRRSESGEATFVNADEFKTVLEKYDVTAGRFLLDQLFDVKVLGVEAANDAEESVLSSRACFNSEPYRNLEKYLNLIVRFATPEPRATFKLYQDAVERVARGGISIASILEGPEYHLRVGELAHDQFWRVLMSRSFDFTQSVAMDAIDTLVEYLPHYCSVDTEARGLRERSIYSLIRLLDRAGWGRTEGRRRPNTSENIVEIARRIYGEGIYTGKGLIPRLASDERGVLGWHDLMLFRLQCSADRQGQIFNVHSALIIHDDMSAPTTGLVSLLALTGMRTLSQRVFRLFRDTFIEPRRNYLAEVDKTPDDAFFGDTAKWLRAQSEQAEGGSQRLVNQLLACRSAVKSFVVFQLVNRAQPNGSGVGCGLYDESGAGDSGGIGVVMNKYIFEVCFNPLLSGDNIYHFADYCLRNFRSSFWTGGDEEGYVATETGLAGALDQAELTKYWASFGQQIKELNLPKMDRLVVTPNYVAKYSEDLPKAFAVLDNMIVQRETSMAPAD